MRSLVIAVTVLCSVTMHAEPTFRFYTDQSSSSVGSGHFVYVQNTSDEVAHDLVVTIELSERLTFRDIPSGGPEWTCTATDRFETCRMATMAPQAFSGLYFTSHVIDPYGGHHAVTATLTARGLGAPAVVLFDLVSAHGLAVTTADDFGPGSLRAAIENANEAPLCGTVIPCFITFPQSLSHEPPMVIKPAIPLPAIRKCNVHIVGPFELEFPVKERKVVISGENATYGNGLEVRASCAAGVSGVSIKDIAVHSWPWNGIYFEAPEAHAANFEGHLIERVYVGTDDRGEAARPNGSRGIITDSPHEILSIWNSISSGNARSGIAFFRGKRGTVMTSTLRGNGGAGIFSIGVPFFASLNTIEHNGVGVAVSKGTSEAGITGNNIHSNVNLPIDWGLDGRTPSDDESDGVPNAPRVLSAFYDPSPNVTFVRGVVYLRGNRFKLEPSLGNSPRGEAIGVFAQFSLTIFGTPEGGDVPFLLGIPGDHRGKFIAVQVHAVNENNRPVLSSEISEGIEVP